MSAERFIEESVKFIHDNVLKRGFKKVVLGLSGGLDSAVVASLAIKALGVNNVGVLFMPSRTSSPQHLQDAKDFAKSLGLIISLSVPIEAYQDQFEIQQSLNLSNSEKSTLRMGNFCSRIRMILLYDFAAEQNALVLGTSNKSEIMLGYGTIFGDLACAINPLGSVYKSEVVQIARILQVPTHIIEKEPSADLFAGQSDRQDLGYGYDKLDPLLAAMEAYAKNLVSKGKIFNSVNDVFNILNIAQSSLLDSHKISSILALKDRLVGHLQNLGFDKDMIISTLNRVQKNIFKCYMPPIFKTKSFLYK